MRRHLGSLGLGLMLLLSACVDAGTRPAASTELVDSADQVLMGFETTMTREGVRRASIVADTARMYEASQSLALRKMTMIFYDGQGVQRSQLVADSAQLFWSTNLVLAHGNVEMTAPDGQILRTQALRIDENAREISTDVAFTLSGGQKFVRGTSLKTDPEFRNIVATKPRGFSDEPMDLPGQ